MFPGCKCLLKGTSERECIRSTIRYLWQTGLILHGGNKAHCLHAPWALAWCPWNALVEMYYFFYQGENALVPLPFQKRSTQACFSEMLTKIEVDCRNDDLTYMFDHLDAFMALFWLAFLDLCWAAFTSLTAFWCLFLYSCCGTWREYEET